MQALSFIDLVRGPAVWIATVLYVALAACAVATLRGGTTRPALAMGSLATAGTLFTALAITAGVAASRSATRAWWAWDAAFTSQLVLLFLYVGFLSLRAAIDDRRRADRASAVLVLVGLVNLPMIHVALHWWIELGARSPR